MESVVKVLRLGLPRRAAFQQNWDIYHRKLRKTLELGCVKMGSAGSKARAPVYLRYRQKNLRNPTDSSLFAVLACNAT